MTRSLIAAALLATLLGACAPAAPTVPRQTPMPPAVRVDPRLQPALDELAAHPERTGGVPLAAFTVTEVLPETDVLCVALSRQGQPPMAVAVDVETQPWRVFSVGYVDPAGPDEYQVPYNLAGPSDIANTAELCAATLAGTLEGWPTDPAAISVSGYLDSTGVADAIRRAVFEDPGAFGIDRDGLPSISIAPVDAPGTDPTAPEPLDGCLALGVYVGGPRASVHVRVHEGGGGWVVDRVRLVRQATVIPAPPDESGC